MESLTNSNVNGIRVSQVLERKLFSSPEMASNRANNVQFSFFPKFQEVFSTMMKIIETNLLSGKKTFSETPFFDNYFFDSYFKIKS